jgi:RNA-directed DNA polymerase
MTTVAAAPMDRWEMLPWKQLQRSVFKLQKRIYRAACRDDVRTVRKLQRLLVKSRAARLLAVRRVAQENQGKRSAGVDGVKSLTPPQRLALAQTLSLGQKAQPVRRVWIPKPDSTEQRPLGIPVIGNRAGQALVKAVLEPEWEARFEPNSYGFRPGRSCQDAIDAIFASIAGQAKYVLDADIAQCFDRLSHSAILAKVHTSPSIHRQLKAWLKAGVVDHGELFPTPVGTIQGGNVSPLLINIALHGLETLIGKRFRRNGCTGFNPPRVIRYGDDLAILHRDEQIVHQCQELVSTWLSELGLELKPSKTRITHTLTVPEGIPGFEFLGFAIRHYPVGKTRSAKDTRGRLLGYKTQIVPSPGAIQYHVQQLRTIIKSHRHASQEALIRLLNPVIVGWARYYARVGSAHIFQSLDNRLYGMLRAWATYRHPNKSKRWIARRYWTITSGHGWIFQPPQGEVHRTYAQYG